VRPQDLDVLKRDLADAKRGRVSGEVQRLVVKMLEDMITAQEGAPADSVAGIKVIVEEYLKENANDAARLKIVRWGKPFDLAGAYYWSGKLDRGGVLDRSMNVVGNDLWMPFDVPGVAIAVKFRSTNQVGALTLRTLVFVVQNGEVTGELVPESFQASRPKPKGDPAMEQLIQSFESVR